MSLLTGEYGGPECLATQSEVVVGPNRGKLLGVVHLLPPAQCIKQLASYAI